MAEKRDKSITTVIVDGKQGINELGKLEMEAKDLNVQLKGLKKGTDEYAATSKKLKEVNSNMAALRKEVGITGMTMRQLRSYAASMQKEIDGGTTRGTARYRELKTEIQRVNAAIRQQRAEVAGLNTMWSKVSAQVKQFGLLALSYLGVSALISGFNNLISKAGELSDTLAGVSKTTSMTAEQVDRLNRKLGDLNTRTARKELLDMAKVAGKLGLK